MIISRDLKQSLCLVSKKLGTEVSIYGAKLTSQNLCLLLNCVIEDDGVISSAWEWA